MNKKHLFYWLCLSIISVSCTRENKHIEEQKVSIQVAQRFHEAEYEFSKRWTTFCNRQGSFALWHSNCNSKVLKERFDLMQKERWVEYFTNPEDFGKKGVLGKWKPIYKVPLLWHIWNSRYPYPFGFDYNSAYPSYNASLINLGKTRFIAMEGPNQENIGRFLHLLMDYRVTDLVRLTPPISNGLECSYNYWDGRVHLDDHKHYLELNGLKINYIATEAWNNHEGINPQELLALICRVREGPPENKIIGVHCRAGVGRTGTFIAGYALISEIDTQLKNGVHPKDVRVSVDEVVWKVSLQRAFALSNFDQYETVYRLVDYYLHHLESTEHL